jgi:hypothetical protein
MMAKLVSFALFSCGSGSKINSNFMLFYSPIMPKKMP